MTRHDTSSARGWLSDDPDKARAERFFLLYSPLWIAAVGLVQLTGWMRGWGDVGFMLFGLVLGLAPVLWPLTWPPAARRHALRFHLWIALFVFVGSYVLSHYFFDVLGMHYRFPTQWSLQAVLVGDSGQEVPLFLYPLTQAYFVTYHVFMIVVLRRLARTVDARVESRFARRVLWGLGLVGLSYAVALGESAFMANEWLSDWFWYADRGWMLRWGSLYYASYFVVSVPLLGRLDEHGDDGRSPGAIALEALGAGMAVMLLLELWSAWLLQDVAW